MAPKVPPIRILLVRVGEVARTDLVCIACGRFRTEYAIERNDGEEVQAGLHAGCIKDVETGAGE